VPRTVRQLLNHCLERDPRARLRDVADARLLLEPASSEATPRSALSHRNWLRGALAVASGIAFFAAGLYWSRAVPSPIAESVRRVMVPLSSLPPVSTSPTGPALALAPDGSTIAFVGRRGEQHQLFVHRLADGTTTPIRGVFGPVTPVFSPDSRWVAFGAGSAVWRAPAVGGQAEILCTHPGGLGQPWKPHPDGLDHAVELVALVRDLGDFSVGVAAFPGGHPEAVDLDADAGVLVAKAAAGADYAITQLFFEAEPFLALVRRVRGLGCDMPIIPGIMPITSLSQVQRFAELSGTSVPTPIVDRFRGLDDPHDVRATGVELATALCRELIDSGVPGLHFYTLNRSKATREIFAALHA